MTERAQLGRYKLLKRLAVGGMGEVFLAREHGISGFQRLVVVKRLLPDLAERDELVDLFVDEARLAAHLSHPNIVQVYDFGNDAGSFFLAMEYVPGHNLAQIVDRAERRGEPIPLAMVVHVVAEMARGLEFAHRAKDAEGNPLELVHRDVSPHNVLVSYHGDVKLMDFGIAKASTASHRTRTGIVRGKLCYMSPEQVHGFKVDPRTDVFACGVMLWELTLGRRLFAGENDVATVLSVKEARIPLPRSLDPDYPEALEEIVLGCLRLDRSERTQSAGALSASLRAFLGTLSVDKEELGALVRRYFPEEPLPEVPEVDDGSEESTKVLEEVVPGGRTPSHPIAEVASSTPPAKHGRRPHYALALAVVGVLAAIGVWTGRGSEIQRRDEPALALETFDAAPMEYPDPDERADVATSIAEVSSPRKIRPKPERAPTPVQPSPIPVVVVPNVESPTAPRLGTLIVASDPWGTVTIDGRGRGHTDLQVSLDPGEHVVTVEVSQDGGSFTSQVTVASEKKTKCRVAQKVLSCAPPR